MAGDREIACQDTGSNGSGSPKHFQVQDYSQVLQSSTVDFYLGNQQNGCNIPYIGVFIFSPENI